MRKKVDAVTTTKRKSFFDSIRFHVNCNVEKEMNAGDPDLKYFGTGFERNSMVLIGRGLISSLQQSILSFFVKFIVLKF
jgi:hypothetical protein